jgi:hypothetical protein
MTPHSSEKAIKMKGDRQTDRQTHTLVERLRRPIASYYFRKQTQKSAQFR